MQELASIFPPVEVDPAYDVAPARWSEDFQNYESVDEDPNATDEVNNLLTTACLNEFDS